MVLVEKWAFFHVFFEAIQSKERSFTIFWNKKNAFLGYKTRISKLRKSDIFAVGVKPWLWSKNVHFSKFFFEAIQARNMSFTIF